MKNNNCIKEKYKNILLISHEMTYTGAPKSLLNIAKLMKSITDSITVWTLVDGEFKREFEKENINVYLVPKEINKKDIERYQLVILNTFFTAYLNVTFQKYVRTILYIREAQNISLIAEKCNLSIEDVCRAKEVVCVSEYAESYLNKVCKPKKITVIHNYVQDIYKKKLNIVKNGVINFLISGTYEERKGYDIAIKAFLSMPNDLKKITRLHLVGQMPVWSKKYWEDLREYYDYRIIEHGLISDQKELFNLYEKMNVFIVPSRDEACSLVALEGAMLGKAVLMSKNVGAQYLEQKKENLYETENIEDLCRKMCELTSRKELILRGYKMRRMYKRTSTNKKYKKDFYEMLVQDKGDKTL